MSMPWAERMVALTLYHSSSEGVMHAERDDGGTTFFTMPEYIRTGLVDVPAPFPFRKVVTTNITIPVQPSTDGGSDGSDDERAQLQSAPELAPATTMASTQPRTRGGGGGGATGAAAGAAAVAEHDNADGAGERPTKRTRQSQRGSSSCCSVRRTSSSRSRQKRSNDGD